MTDQTHSSAPPDDSLTKPLIDWEKYAPRTLMARASLIIVVPLIIVQIISTYIFYENHWDTMSRRMAASLAGDVATVTAFVRDYPGPENLAWLQANMKRTLDFDVRYKPNERLTADNLDTSVFDDLSDASGDVLAEALWESLRKPFRIDLVTFRAEKMIAIDVQTDQGVIEIQAPRRRLFSSTTYVFVIWMVGSSMLLFGVATVFLRNQVKSVRRLARAVDEFGKGRDVADFPAEGAFEVRQAARAFNIMRGRIKRQITQRTEMLAGVSHDLRTPLTRMKLQLEMASSGMSHDDIAALKDDTADMERMLDAYLAFARGEGNEDSQPTDIAAVIDSVAAKFRRDGSQVSVVIPMPLGQVPLRPVAFERCLNNLVGNAVRYAKTVTVSGHIRAQAVEIVIDDDGPGIPADRREDVFRPFTRLEESRNPKTGGVGLGLTISRDIARAMGGDVTLSESPAKGLRATIRLPL